MDKNTYRIVDESGKLLVEGTASNINAYFNQRKVDNEISRSTSGNITTIIVWE